MGKRSNFERRERDLYATTEDAFLPLVPHLSGVEYVAELCCGNGALVRLIHKHTDATVSIASDIVPLYPGAVARDLHDVTELPDGIVGVTNTPWPAPRGRGEPTVSMALHLSNLAPHWLLLPADFAHNVYFSKSGLADRCLKYLSVGRVSWMENGVSGKENAAWFLFDANHQGGIQFIPRAA